MEADSEILEFRDASVKECASDELVQRIRKLRWMGMDEEAERLLGTLREVHQADILLSGPGDTD